MVALLSAMAGPAGAGVLTSSPSQTNIYDLVRDGLTSSDGGDGTVKGQDRAITAITALELATGHWQPSSFVGPVDQAANAGNAFPAIPLGAANGTKSEQDFASSFTVPGQRDLVQKAQATGQTRISSLVGSVGAVLNEKVGGTVFVAALGATTFAPTGNSTNGAHGTAVVSAPSSTSTTTITMAGVGGLPRAEARGGSFIAAAGGLQNSTTVSGRPQIALSSSPQPPISYNYTPMANEGVRVITAVAAFSDVVTATGKAPGPRDTSGPSKPKIGVLQSSIEQPLGSTIGLGPTAEVRIGNDVQTEALLAVQPWNSDKRLDRPRTFMSTSVGVDPRAITGGVVARHINSARTDAVRQSVETFQVGLPSASRSRDAATATISDPLRAKIMASTGALNNSLALP